jgi:chaperonin GroEL (HSP60 family)
MFCSDLEKMFVFYFSQIVAAGANPVQIARGIEKTAKALVGELRKMSKEVRSGPSGNIFILNAKLYFPCCSTIISTQQVL